ncbi:type II toxin-antitoxin system PemK/MazF family toxin [Virgibacillus sp. JSM 102003]|uniref:type II toxin-antitoxin system PemK/MazF family toxin n=1 Tax=Virgibacillus sp. JSM 102003 TaxID=1562108 RepID=UPI0035C19BD2
MTFYKKRPVVVVGRDITIDIDVIISPVTSSRPRSEYDVKIEHWAYAGLIHLIVARTAKIHAIPQSSLINKLGNLHENDLQKVLRKCKELF